jgi:hypothetical protein
MPCSREEVHQGVPDALSHLCEKRKRISKGEQSSCQPYNRSNCYQIRSMTRLQEFTIPVHSTVPVLSDDESHPSTNQVTPIRGPPFGPHRKNVHPGHNRCVLVVGGTISRLDYIGRRKSVVHLPGFRPLR